MFLLNKNSSIPYERQRSLQGLCKALGLEFNDLELLDCAFTHSSYLNESHYNIESNERLEFLGDAVIGLITNEYLYKKYSGSPEGQLSSLKSKLVSENTLSTIAYSLNLSQCLLMGKGERETGGETRKSNLANLLEALIGALYLDQGLEITKRFVLKYIGVITDTPEKIINNYNYKTRLQEFCQKKFKSVPQYKIISESGPDHDKIFIVKVSVNNKFFGEGKGKNKKEAEQLAAKHCLIVLNIIQK